MELTTWDIEQLERLCGSGNKQSGAVVRTKSGLLGRTYSHEDQVNGKVVVHTGFVKLLCTPGTMTVMGFVD